MRRARDGCDRGAVTPRANLIAGDWCPAERGATFEPRAGALPAGDERWPQSGEEDVQAALESARAEGREWRERGLAERGERVGGLARALEEEAARSEALTRIFGLRAGELARHREGLAASIEELFPPRAASAELEIALVAPDWRDLWRGALAATARELLAGRAVVLFSDPRLPELGGELAAAALEAGLGHGLVSLLHGSPRELLALAARRGGSALDASGSAERMIELRRLSTAEGIAEPRLRVLRCAAFEVDPGRDLEASAALVVDGAFGRASTFSGQLPGQIARVWCPERRHSRFTELLLGELEASEAARAPLPQIDREAETRVRTAWGLGLDEGATLIAGGDEELREEERVLPPTVFTNVEPAMASARRQEPLPILCLLRAERVATRTHTAQTG